MTFDTAQSHRFLSVLAGSKAVTLQTFSDRDELKQVLPNGDVFDPSARWRHGPFHSLESSLRHLNARGAGVYVMVNQGDGKGRTAKNVLEVRALFIDTDGAPLPTSTPLEPHLKVESSCSRYHLYWLVSGLQLSDFSVLQQALAEYYGSDQAVKDLPRVMRLPGFFHHKAEPVMVKLLEAFDRPPYTPADVYAAWPFLAARLEDKQAATAERERRRQDLLDRTAARRSVSLEGITQRARAERLLLAHHDAVASAGNGTRHNTLLRSACALGGYIAGGHLETVTVEDTLLAAAELCGLPDSEVQGVIRWGLAKGAERPLDLLLSDSYSAPSTSKRKPPNRQSRLYARMRGWHHA